MLSQNQTEASWIPTQQSCVMEMLSKHFLNRRMNLKFFPESAAHNISMMLCRGKWNISTEQTGPCQFQSVTSCEHLPGTKYIQFPGGNTKAAEAR